MFLKELPIVQQKDAEARHKLATTNQTETPQDLRTLFRIRTMQWCNHMKSSSMWLQLWVWAEVVFYFKTRGSQSPSPNGRHTRKRTLFSTTIWNDQYRFLDRTHAWQIWEKWKRTPQDSSEIYNLLGKPDCESWVMLMEDIVSSVLPRRGGIWTLANFVEGRNKKVGSKGKEVSPEGGIMIYQGSPLLSGKY